MKKRGTKRRILATLMTAAMVAGAVPGVSFADKAMGRMAPEDSMTPVTKKYSFDGKETTSDEPDIELSKTAVYNADDDTYTITLAANAKQLIRTKPTHVVFLLDASGSMNYCTERAREQDYYYGKTPDYREENHVHYGVNAGDEYSNQWVKVGCTLIDYDSSVSSRWKIATKAIKTMSDNLGHDGITYDYVYFNDDAKDSSDSSEPYRDVERVWGSTKLMHGVEYAVSKFGEDSKDTDKVLIVVADGESNDGYFSSALEKFKTTKGADAQNGKVYTVGFTFSSSKFSALSSGKDYNFDAANESELKVSLNRISENIKSLISDPLGDNVELEGDVSVSGSDLDATTANNTISWNDPAGLQKVVLTYKVKVKPEAKKAGTIDLNGKAVLNYTDGTTTKTVDFPTPSVTAAALTVDYVDSSTGNTVKTDTDWIGLTGKDATFKNITEIPETIDVDGTTYYVKGSDPETIPVPTEGKEYKVTVYVSAEEEQDPDLPSYDELKDLIGDIVLVHTGSNAEHPDEMYELIDGSYTVASASNARAIVKVNVARYAEAYNEEYGDHSTKGKTSRKLIFVSAGDGWELEEGELPVTFTVECTGKEPEIPDLPDYDEIKDLFDGAITVTCITDAEHADQKFGLLKDSYGMSKDSENDYAAIIIVYAKNYIKAFNDGKHENAGDNEAYVKVVYSAEDGKWYAGEQDIAVSFKAKCGKKTPEKQYTDIRFVVVNGTFTENGKTEITKSFEVGTKLTSAEIPASKGINSSYSDMSWDKDPLGYTVDKDGATFTITYRWRSSGGGSGSGGGSSHGSTTRKYATDASGKHGRWILEGGEFTEDNGRLPSNEYLKIGDTIYGFYTYGFAIDFDRPEYYTDAAIRAKGGYREANGTWRLNGWWFCYDDGTFPHSEWKYLTWNGHSDWYYFDVDGWMEDGWLRWNNNWYYLHTKYDNTRGHMYTGWHEIDGKWYYFNTAADKGTLGALLTNTTTPDGFQVDANGAWIR